MPNNAAIYISDPSMIGSRLFDDIPAIEAYEDFSSNENATGFLLKMPWGHIKLNIMPSEHLPNHLKGFEGYIRNQQLSKDELIYTLSRLYYVRMCLGCEIVHTSESEDDVIEFLASINSLLNGLMFIYDSVLDWNGEALCGPLKND
ncbi:MAG: hypothetical protein WCG35_11385 [Betaproteobacteria bacterium]